MKRTLTVVGAAVIALAGAVAASQAQGSQGAAATGEQRAGRHEFDCGPGRGAGDQGPGARLGRGEQRPQGALQGRGPGGGRRGGLGMPGGPGGPGGPGRLGGRGGPLCGLDLTDDQKAQIASIHEKTRGEIEAVLTPEQREKLQARRGRK
jgi:Spy/CpxP family protein refolding chaperone